MFCKSRTTWKNMPSGLLQTVLCNEKLQSTYERTDEQFYYTMQETGLASNSDEMRKLRADYTYSYFPREMHSIRYFPSLVKYLDPSRPSVSEEKGSREWVRMRLGETYLLAAEAAGR